MEAKVTIKPNLLLYDLELFINSFIHLFCFSCAISRQNLRLSLRPRKNATKRLVVTIYTHTHRIMYYTNHLIVSFQNKTLKRQIAKEIERCSQLEDEVCRVNWAPVASDMNNIHINPSLCFRWPLSEMNVNKWKERRRTNIKDYLKSSGSKPLWQLTLKMRWSLAFNWDKIHFGQQNNTKIHHILFIGANTQAYSFRSCQEQGGHRT